MTEQSGKPAFPPIEEKIEEVLHGETQINARDFAAFLRENELLPEGHDSGDGWSILYKGESIGFIKGFDGENELWVWFNACDFECSIPADDELKEFAWAHVSVCRHCGCEQQNFPRTIYGKDYESTCHSPLAFIDPDAETLENMKKLLLMLKQHRLEQCSE